MSNGFERDFIKRFSALEAKMLKVEKNLGKISNEILTTQGMKPQSYWRSIEKRIAKEYVELEKAFTTFSKTEIPKRFRNSVYQMHNKIKGLKSVTEKARQTATKLINTNGARQIVNSLYADAIARYTAGVFSGERMMKSLIRETQQALVDEAFINRTVAEAFEGGNVRDAKKLLKAEFQKQLAENALDKKFITIKGRNYKVHTYAEMLLRTKFHEAQAEAAKLTALNHGTDLVIVSTHNTTTQICMPFEGKVFSISGRDNRFPLLRDEPPFHPNCLHLMYPQFESGMQAQGSLQQFSSFSKGNTPKPPYPANFIPISQRGVS